MSARDRFLVALYAKVGAPVLWATKGPDSFDCSGLFTACLYEIGGPDLRHVDNAQGLHDLTRALQVGELPLPGDGVFYGNDDKSIEHVAVYTSNGGIISADGATSRITSLALALANPSCRVRTHNTIHYRSDTPFITVRRNVLVDNLDAVTT